MRKKEVIKKRSLSPDRKFSSLIITQLINKVMKNGEKRKAMKIVYHGLQIAEEKASLPLLTILEGALANTKPELELKSRKLGGANYRIPTKISEQRALSLSLRWLVESAQKKKSAKPMFQRLAEELVDAYNKTGEAFRKKETIHKEAVSNMAFAR